MSTLSPLAADSSLRDRVGFMQGRMSAPIDGRVQAFPWSSWQEELSVAEKNGFRLMEWTLDQDQLYENPLMTVAGQVGIRELVQRHGVSIPSLTGDCFMRAPFWKAHGEDRESLTRDFLAVAAACCKVGISMLIVPLVDNGRLESSRQEDILVEFLRSERPYFEALSLRVLFESDFEPPTLRRFIERLDSDSFGINYDIGNSAALGLNAAEEIGTYGRWIRNVHVKDRELAGMTVPLGAGVANFESVFTALNRARYEGNFILQTARAADGDHISALCRYRDMTVDWLRHA